LRESAVLEQLARGLSYDDVASVLGVSVNTVRTYVRLIYDKLSVTSRTEAVLVALKLGIINRMPFPITGRPTT
jgi:two-component system NarL family response regulator